MITRLLLCVILMLYTIEAKSDCTTRVDILNGADLSAGLSVLMTTTTRVTSPAQCAIQCHLKKCDVAYYHWDRKECQFTADSSSNSLLSCEEYQATRLLDENPDMDSTQRFCLKCSPPKKSILSQPLKSIQEPPKAKQLKFMSIPSRPSKLFVDWQPAASMGWRQNRIVHISPLAVPPRPSQRRLLSRYVPTSFSTDYQPLVTRSVPNQMSGVRPSRVRVYGRTIKKPSGISRFRPHSLIFKRKYFHKATKQERTQNNPSLKTRGNGVAK